MRHIHVNLVVDEKFMLGATVSAASVCVNAKPETKLVFHLFTENVKDVSVDFFRRTVLRLHANAEIIQFACSDDTLKGLPRWGGSRMSALRCSYAKLLPDVDVCVHLDADVLFLAPIEEYVNFLRSDAYVVASVEQDPATAERECDWIKRATGVTIPQDQYFLAGMMVMNLKKIRNDGLADVFGPFFEAHPDVYSPDMDALNTFFVGKVVIVPRKWNLLQTILTDGELAQRPVIHYVSGVPWTPKLGAVANGRFRLWHAFADKYVWQKKGESYRRCFSWRVLMAKRAMYWILKTPLVGLGFAKLLARMHRVVNPKGWIRAQVGCDISDVAIDAVLEKSFR